MAWRLAFSPRASRELAALRPADHAAIRLALDRLTVDFGSGDVRKLGGRTGVWRLRVGRWRVLLELDNREGVITVTRVVARDRAYRD